jgi:hypothetical protein
MDTTYLDTMLRKHKERIALDAGTTYVYLISNGSEVKIGTTVHPQKRLKELQTSNAKTLTIFKLIECDNRNEALRIEGELHEKCWDCHANGEWFDLEKLAQVLLLCG